VPSLFVKTTFVMVASAGTRLGSRLNEKVGDEPLELKYPLVSTTDTLTPVGVSVAVTIPTEAQLLPLQLLDRLQEMLSAKAEVEATAKAAARDARRITRFITLGSLSFH